MAVCTKRSSGDDSEQPASTQPKLLHQLEVLYLDFGFRRGHWVSSIEPLEGYMSDDDKIATAISKGKRAELLLQDELLTGAFKALEASYIEGWRNSEARDTDARERLWHAVQVVGKVQQHLQVAVSNGKIAQRDLDDIAKKKPRFGIV